jgi:hypothetical protein
MLTCPQDAVHKQTAAVRHGAWHCALRLVCVPHTLVCVPHTHICTMYGVLGRPMGCNTKRELQCANYRITDTLSAALATSATPAGEGTTQCSPALLAAVALAGTAVAALPPNSKMHTVLQLANTGATSSNTAVRYGRATVDSRPR